MSTTGPGSGSPTTNGSTGSSRKPGGEWSPSTASTSVRPTPTSETGSNSSARLTPRRWRPESRGPASSIAQLFPPALSLRPPESGRHSLPFPADWHALPGRYCRGVELEKLSDGVWAWLQPGGGSGISNAGVVADDDGLTVIDTLMVRSQWEPFAAAVAELGPPVRR